MRDKHLATAPGQSVHATEVDYLYDTHAVRTADYNAIRSEIQSLQKSLRERDSESFNVETGVRGAANASRRECECRRFPLLGPSVERVCFHCRELVHEIPFRPRDDFIGIGFCVVDGFGAFASAI